MNPGWLGAGVLTLLLAVSGCQQPPKLPSLPQSGPSIDDARLRAGVSWLEGLEGTSCLGFHISDSEPHYGQPIWPPEEEYRGPRGESAHPEELREVAAAARKLKERFGPTQPDVSRRLNCRLKASQLLPQPSFSGAIEVDGIAFVHLQYHWGEGWLALKRFEQGWRVVGLALGAVF